MDRLDPVVVAPPMALQSLGCSNPGVEKSLRARTDMRNATLQMLLASQARGLVPLAFKLGALLSFILLFPTALTFTLQQFAATEPLAHPG